MFSNPVVFQTVVFGRGLELHLFGAFCALASSLIYPLYIIAMVKGMRPPRSTWSLWFLLDIAAFVSRWNAGIFDVQLLVYTVGTFFVMLFTVRYGESAWTKTDTYCTWFVVATVVVWLVGGPSVATVCALSGLTVASVPLLQKVFAGKYESRLAWTLAIVGSIFNLLDGQLLTGVWFIVLQVAILAPVVYHWGIMSAPPEEA